MTANVVKLRRQEKDLPFGTEKLSRVGTIVLLAEGPTAHIVLKLRAKKLPTCYKLRFDKVEKARMGNILRELRN